LYFIYYIRWIGTPTEFDKYYQSVKKISSDIEGLKFMGAYMPSSEWNYAFLFEAKSFDSGMEVYRKNIKKYEGQHPQEFVGKLELLFSLEEVGFPD
jgi:hypothetical protein